MMSCLSRIMLKLRFMVKDAGRRAKHTHQWCGGTHHPPRWPPHHFCRPQGRLWGLQARDLQWGAFSSGTRGVLTGFYEVQSELLFPPTLQLPFLRARNSLLTQRKILVCGFLWLEKCTWNWPIASFFFAEKSWAGRRCCQILHLMVGFCTVHAHRWLKHYGWFQSRRHNPGKGSHCLCISVLRLYYSCYTNKLFRPCPKQMPVFGGINGHHFPHTLGIVHRNQVYIPKMWAHLLPIAQNWGY